MPKDQWARNANRRSYRKIEPKIRPKVAAAWARFDRVVGGKALPGDIASEPRRSPAPRKFVKKKEQRKQKEEKPAGRVWVEDYGEYLLSAHWIAKRKEAFECHGRKCHDCGAKGNLEVHHKTYRRLGREKMKDLQVLCKDCHKTRHEGMPRAVSISDSELESRSAELLRQQKASKNRRPRKSTLPGPVPWVRPDYDDVGRGVDSSVVRQYDPLLYGLPSGTTWPRTIEEALSRRSFFRL